MSISYKKMIAASFIVTGLLTFAYTPFVFGSGGEPPIPTPSTPPPVEFKNPLQRNSVEEVLAGVLRTIQGIVAVLAMVFLVIGGILYITSSGNQSRTELAKNAIWAAVIGLALAVAAPSFLKEIYDVLGGTPPPGAPSSIGLAEIAMNVLEVLLSFVGILSVAMLVVGGIMYMSAAGDQTRADTAKKIIQYAIIGLVVALTSLVIVTQIAKVFT